MGNLSEQKAEILDQVGDNPLLTDNGSIMDTFHAANSSTEITKQLRELEADERMRVTSGAQPEGTFAGSKRFEGLHGGLADKDKKDKKDDHTTYLLLQLQQINREIEYLQMERDDLMELRDLIENGEFDQENPEHMELIERLGIDPDEFFAMSMEEQLQVLDGRIEENKEKELDLKSKAEGIEERLDAVTDTRDAFESHYSNDEITAAYREEELLGSDETEDTIDLEAEIERFMHSHAKAIADNDMQALEKATKELPEECREMFVDTEYEALFEKGYFAQFKENQTEVQSMNPQLQATETYSV